MDKGQLTEKFLEVVKEQLSKSDAAQKLTVDFDRNLTLKELYSDADSLLSAEFSMALEEAFELDGHSINASNALNETSTLEAWLDEVQLVVDA